MTAWSSVASNPRKRQRAASSFPIPPRKSPQEGEIIAVGPGARDEAGKLVPLDVKAGDRVLFGKWSGTEVKIDGQGSPDHEGIRHHGHHRLSRRLQFPVVTPFI